MYVLDVGCGTAPVGDVNCDLYLEDKEKHRSADPALVDTYRINLKNTPNFVCCSSKFLPFKSGCFDLVTSRQVIEHVPNPLAMASEMARVSRNFVVIETVHRRGERLMSRKMRRWLSVHHINKFDFSNLSFCANRVGVSVVKSEVLDYNYFLHFRGFKLFRVPFGIRVVWSKQVRDFSIYRGQIDAKRQYLEAVGL